MSTARQQYRANRARVQPIFFGEVFNKDNCSMGFIGTSFNLVKSPKARLALTTADLDDWMRVAPRTSIGRIQIHRGEHSCSELRR